MLARYKMYRGSRPADDPLPKGIRQDTRKHTRHCLRPDQALVARFLAEGSDAGWEVFSRDYLAELQRRFAADRQPFDELASLAREEDVYLGCSCPTKRNPVPGRCHTVLALKFIKGKFPDLEVEGA